MTKNAKNRTETKDEQITVKLDNDLRNEIEAIAEKEDRTLAQVARIALKEFVQRRKESVAA